ncbi:AMP-binding protein [Novosphingobium panipatense]
MPGHHPSHHARATPEALALIVADTGEALTYRELDEGSNRVAQLLRSLGLRPGDRIGVMLRNSPDFSCIYWGATRCGCFVTLLSNHLKPLEAAYIVRDAQVRALFLSGSIGDTPRILAADRRTLVPEVDHVFAAGDEDGENLEGAASLGSALQAMPARPVEGEISGFHMIYSSGTTGRPKGIVLPFTPGPIDEFNALEGALPIYRELRPLVSLNAGPLYHGAPLSGMVTAQRLGACL